MARARKIDQLAMDEEVRVEPDLEAALELMDRRKGSLAAVQADYDEAREQAIGGIARLELAVGQVVRIGRFRIEKKLTPAGTVSFDRSEKERIAISTGEE